MKFFGGQIGRFLLRFDRRLGLPEPVTVPTCDYRRLAHRFSPPSTLHNRVRYLTLNMGMMIWHIPRGICEFFGFATSYHRMGPYAIWPRFRVFGFRQLPFGCAFAEHDTIAPHNSSVLSLGYLSSHER